MSAGWGMRYSVCRPGEPPVEVYRLYEREKALQLAKEERAAGRVAETWDWLTNEVIDDIEVTA